MLDQLARKINVLLAKAKLPPDSVAIIGVGATAGAIAIMKRGEIDATTKTVHNVIDDVEAYTSFMPYTAECRVIERNPDFILTYQRVSPKIVSDRDYTLRIEKKSWPVENGLAYLNRWEPANEHGPAEKPGIFRVKVCQGSWLLEPAGESKTRATYSVFTDSGIIGPAFLANTISTTGISKLFAAVRKQAKNPKYQSK